MKNYYKIITGVILVGIIVVAIVLLEQRKPEQARNQGGAITIMSDSERVQQKEQQYQQAVEISSPDAFINTLSDSLVTISELIGKKVILVDFWTYSCINCQRTLPYLNDWYEKYHDKGLEIIGIHTPEFEFEKELSNVQRAVDKYDIEYPVVLDNDYSTWRGYNNRYWPRKYLIDIDGFIVYDHIGEGAYEETEAKIVELLNERNKVLGEGTEVSVEKREVGENVDFAKIQTPETYLGAQRGDAFANLDTAATCENGVCVYDTPPTLDPNKVAFDGKWKIGDEFSELKQDRGSLTLKFTASKVNLVMGAPAPVRARVLLDGKIVNTTSSGSAVMDGEVIIDMHDLYNLVDLGGAYEEHTLTVEFMGSGVQVFAFTFG